MEHDGIDSGETAAVESVSADKAPASSQEATQSQDLLKNLKAELNRKISKTNETMKSELAQIKQLLLQSQTRTPVEKTEIYSESPDYKRYVDARFQEAQRAEIQKAQQDAWTKA